ncbi:MAG: YdbL family protein [Desulfopila sp.]
MKLSHYSSLLILLVCLLLLVPAVQSASIKERMKARIPAIDTLKDKGLVGENSQGFLEYRTAQKVRQDLIASENKDRKIVYEAIGKRQGAPAKLVGQRRAKMIVENGEKGHWFQRPNGQWYRK